MSNQFLRAGWIGMIGLLLGAWALPGQAQVDPDVVQRLERQLRQIDSAYRLSVPPDQPISERLLWDYGGSLRFGILGVDNQFGNTRVLRQTDGLLYMRAELDGAHRFYGRLRFLYNDFNSGDSFDEDGDDLEEPIADRYWYQFDLRADRLARSGQRIDHNFGLKVGRQFVQWGSGLTLSNALYAALVSAEWGNLGFVGLAGLTPSTGTIDFDGSRPGFDSDTDRAFYGAAIEYRGGPNHRPYVSFLVQRDYNERDKKTFITPIGDFPTKFDYDSEYLAIGSRGTLGPKLTYRIELLHESGDGLSNSFDPATGLAIVQTREDIDAWAGILGLTYMVRDENDSRIELEIAAGSGDDDRLDAADTFGGNAPGTDDRGFNGLGYVDTGLALAPELSNLLSIRFGANTSPRLLGVRPGHIRIGVNGYLFAKIDSSAPINVRTNSSTFVGGEVDLSVDWRIASDVSASLRYGIFIPGDAMPAREDDPRHFVYAGVTYAF